MDGFGEGASVIDLYFVLIIIYLFCCCAVVHGKWRRQLAGSRVRPGFTHPRRTRMNRDIFQLVAQMQWWMVDG